MKLEGKTVFVTGGASGLGEGVVRYIVEHGGHVIIADINKKRGNKLANELSSSKALFVKCDVTSEEKVQYAINEGLKKFGAIHGCVNCTGIAPPRRTLSKSGTVHPLKHFRQVIEINLIGTFNVLRLCAKAMINNEPDAKTKERGVIVNVASIAAFDGQIGQAAYSASKSAVCGMTLPIARDLGHWGIRICTIAPGIFNTPLGKHVPKAMKNEFISSMAFPERNGEPEEFAYFVGHIFKNTYLNGEVIRLDAGIRL